MRDIFDILKTRKDKRINIRGEVAQGGLMFDIEHINDLIELVLSNEDEVETKTFEIREYKGQAIVSNFGIYSDAYEPEVKSIEFEIDINVTSAFYDKLEYLEDFIDYYTVGAVTYKFEDECMITVDSTEEYMTSARRRMDDDDRVSFDWDVLDTLLNIRSRPVQDWQMGSHDADGDVMYAASFRPTDMSGMFSNCSNFDLSRLD